MALPGNPRGRAFRCASPGDQAGRRRAIGVVAVLSATPARPRRWCDAGTPDRPASQKAGAPGRRTTRNVPHRPLSKAMCDGALVRWCDGILHTRPTQDSSPLTSSSGRVRQRRCIHTHCSGQARTCHSMAAVASAVIFSTLALSFPSVGTSNGRPMMIL